MSVDLDQKIDPSSKELTLRFVTSKLNGRDPIWDCCSERLGFKNVNVKLLESSGFMSDIYRISFEFDEPVPRREKPFNVLLKIPTVRKLKAEVHHNDESLQTCRECLFEIHTAEVRFYEEVLPLICNKMTSFVTPRVFATGLPKSRTDLTGAFVLMQELNTDYTGSVPIYESLSNEQIESAIRAIAQLHALSLDLPKGLVDSFVLRADLSLPDDILHISDRLVSLPEKKYANYFKEHASILKEMFKHDYSPVQQHKIFGTTPMLCHGDFWQSNMFFERGQDGKIGDRINAIFDWQIAYGGTGVNDITRLILVGADAELRRQNLDSWLQLYFDSLNKEIAQINEFSKDKIECPYKDMAIVRTIHQHHCHHETLFVMFLYCNVLGGLKNESQREKLLQRMTALFDDQALVLSKNIKNSP